MANHMGIDSPSSIVPQHTLAVGFHQGAEVTGFLRGWLPSYLFSSFFSSPESSLQTSGAFFLHLFDEVEHLPSSSAKPLATILTPFLWRCSNRRIILFTSPTALSALPLAIGSSPALVLWVIPRLLIHVLKLRFTNSFPLSVWIVWTGKPSASTGGTSRWFLPTPLLWFFLEPELQSS